MFSLFSKKTKQEEIIPKPGERWNLSDKSPWPLNYPGVKILDVKDGWVRYYMGRIFPDERMKLEMFLSVYKKEETERN